MATKSTISRRALLGAGATVAGAAVFAAGRETSPASASRPGSYPLYGEHQPGIVTPVQNNLHFAAFDLQTSSRAEVMSLLQKWTDAAERMMAGQPAGETGAIDGHPNLPPDDTGEALDLSTSNLTITFGFGPGFFTKKLGIAGQRPEALEPLPRFPLDQLVAADSGGDICVQACADDPQVAVHAIRNLTRIGFGTVAARWSQLGYGRSSSTTRSQVTPRNLMGFKDGTNNIRADDTELLDEHVWVGSDDGTAWLTGGSYLITRRANITVELWDRQKLRDQEAFIGRTKGEGGPLSGGKEFDKVQLAARRDGALAIPEDAHIRVVSPEKHRGARMLRRGYNFTNGNSDIGHLDAGLFFIGFVRDPRTNFIPVQLAMVRDDGLMEYIRFTSSAIFAAPPGISRGEYVGQSIFEA
jgi:deferrochelatase/peroxidase EfeB